MRRTVIRYKTKPDMADRNAELVAAVFAELKAAQPEGLRYMSLRLEDDTFIHVVETAADDGCEPIAEASGIRRVPERHSGALRRTAAAQRRHYRRQLSHAGRELNPRGGRMTGVPETSAAFDIERLLVAMRPKLHRYCARMVGSVIDGEDVLQDALIKAVEAQATASAIGNPEGWLFRIAHNTALDFLRRRNRQEMLRGPAEVDMMVDQLDAVESRQIAATSLRTFMRLSGGAALKRDPDGRARLLAQGDLRGDGVQPAGGQGRAASRTRAVAGNR